MTARVSAATEPLRDDVKFAHVLRGSVDVGPDRARLELEAQLRANPDDIGAHLVYADLLQAQGDPHGELIVLQAEQLSKPNPALARREKAWMKQHVSVPEGCELIWHLGFVRELRVTRPKTVGPIQKVLASRACRLLSTLRIDARMTQVPKLVAAAPRELRELDVKVEKLTNAPAFGTLLATKPELRRLRVEARFILGRRLAIAVPNLEELAIDLNNDLDLALETPLLTSLVVSVATLCEPAIEAIFDGRYPLRRLGLFIRDHDDDDDDAFHRRWLRSKVFPRLEAIGRFWSETSEEGSRAFAKQFAPWAKKRVFVDPFTKAAEYNLAVSLRDINRLDEALECIELAVRADPQADVWALHGALLEDLGRAPESLASYEHALELDPKHVSALHSISDWHLEVGTTPAKGLPFITRCIKLDPDDGTAWHIRGQLELAVGKPATMSLARAMALFRAAVDADASDAESWFQIACVQTTCGRRGEALDSLAKAIGLDRALKERCTQGFRSGRAAGRARVPEARPVTG